MLPEEIKLTTESKDIEKYILNEESIDNLNDIIDVFNIALKKRNLIRSSKLSEVQDKVVDQIALRIFENPDNFSNEDLLKYYKTIQDTLAKTGASSEDLKVPTIQLNQQINISNTDEFNRESRKKIVDTVNQILSLAKDNSQEIEDVIELSEQDVKVVDER